MNLLRCHARRLTMVTVPTLLLLAHGPSASALVVMPVGGMPLLWIAFCDGGQSFGPWSDPGSATVLGGIFCEPFGGITAVTDASVASAIADQATCGNPSHVTVGEDIGGAVIRPLTESELVALIQPSLGNARQFPELELLSVVVRGTELMATGQASPTPTPITDLFSDEDGDGRFLGGPLACAAPSVPIGPRTALGVLLGLLATGSMMIRRRRTLARPS